MPLRTMDEVNFTGKTVLLRVDINSPVDAAGRLVVTPRLVEAAKTIAELAERGARVVILAHQGRRGRPDFIPLAQHARVLSRYVGRRVRFVDDLVGEKAVKAIGSLKAGEIILLDNVRMLEEETEQKSPAEHARGQLVQTLAPLVDLFVNDAFSAAHRSHASLVGFAAVLPAVAGRLMEREVRSLERVITHAESPHLLILGGAKPEDCIAIAQHLLAGEKVDKVLAGGILGQLLLAASGYDVGEPNREFMKQRGYLEELKRVKDLTERYGEKIEMPSDVAAEIEGRRVEIPCQDLPTSGLIKDIGNQTAKRYAQLIARARTVSMKGPVGVYEEPAFARGTELVLRAITRSHAFSLVGGGDTVAAIDRLGIDRDRISYVSLAGGAFITYLSGKPLPAIEALKGQKAELS